MTTNTLIAYFLQGLMLGWLLQQLFQNRWAWPCGLLLAALPLAGMPLAGHLRGFFGDPSITSIQLLVLALLGRSPKSLVQDWRAPLLIGLGGALFYTLALGGAIKLGMADPYRLGYQPGILLGALATLALFLWWRGQALWLWLLSIDLLAFAQAFELSRNFWDSLLDPQLVFVCLILAYRNRGRQTKANYAPADSTST